MLKIMKASAGSGKTYSLARTYIGLLLKSTDRYAYRHILAVTFTNKATDEMKSRILKELHIMATEPFRSGYRNDFIPSVFASEEGMQQKAKAVLHDILHDYSAFAVSTIDRFFQQTLKAFSREIGQFASYQVELDKDSLVAESVDRILDSLTEDSGGLLSWLTDNVLEQIEHGEKYSLDANLLKMAVRLKSSQRQEAVERAGIDEGKVYSKDNLIKIRSGCRDVIKTFMTRVKESARKALDIIESAGLDPADSNRGFLKVLYVYDDLVDGDEIVAPKDSFFAKAADHDQWFAKAKAGRLKPLVWPFLEAPLEDFCNLWDKEYAVYNTARILDEQIYGLGVAGELRKTFNELMKEKNVLCIEDSNTILRDIIDGSDAPFVYEKIGVRFDHFLLDEFQDTSHVQWTNFSPLLHNSDASGGENLIVGDVKQSIYRWRGSDWDLLDSRIPQEFPEHISNVLDTNYRSLPGVVSFNNGFFPFAAQFLDNMSGYSENGPLSRIYSDVEQKIARTGGQEGSVEFTFCEKEMQLEQVLGAVRNVLEAGAEYSDIAILVRSNSSGEDVASYLLQNGVPVLTDDSLKVKRSITVRRIVSLMSYADNPENTLGSYLADSLDIGALERGSSLIDMAEALIRRLKDNQQDGFRDGEILHVYSFMDCLYDYVASNGNNLRGFLKHWDEIDPSIASPSSGNSVRVMTIHKSKGLDFPYVIIPFAEKITLYKSGSSWCAPDLTGTTLEGVADGVYDVLLSGSSESTLFAEHYRNERFMQQVDNINTIYVAMTRASAGMHIIAKTPSGKTLADFSQILHLYLEQKGLEPECEDGVERFVFGQLVDFNEIRGNGTSGEAIFPFCKGNEYPSVVLNPQLRLRLSADAMDFFNEDGDVGISASNRIRGVVLHDILSRVVSAVDVKSAVEDAVRTGMVTTEEAQEILDLLKIRVSEGEARGWFPSDRTAVLNEVDVIDVNGQVYRPDRVVMQEDKVVIIDYKFGEHQISYENKMRKYMDIWRRMGYSDVKAFLWYVRSGEVKECK